MHVGRVSEYRCQTDLSFFSDQSTFLIYLVLRMASGGLALRLLQALISTQMRFSFFYNVLGVFNSLNILSEIFFSFIYSSLLHPFIRLLMEM